MIVRVPLASGLLTGKYDRSTTFGPGDHRSFNREGAAFDKGETFAGVPYETGLAAVEDLKVAFPGEENLAPIALRWILDHPAVSTVIPGASKAAHLASNLGASGRAPLSREERGAVERVYEQRVKGLVHQVW